MLHRLYKFDLNQKSNIVDKDSYFIPAGYDSLPLLQSQDVQNDLSKIYSEKISSVKAKQQNIEEEITCEDTQSFFKKHYGNSGTSKPAPKEIKDKNLANNYSTNADFEVKTTLDQPEKKTLKTGGTSHSKLNQFKDFYQTNTATSSNILNSDTKKEMTKEEMDKIKKKELDNLLGNKESNTGSAETSEKKPSAQDTLKKRLEALKNK